MPSNSINRNNSFEETPKTGENWNSIGKKNRFDLLENILKKDIKYNDFEIVNAEPDGQVILKIERTIPANKRGVLLLDLEELFKKNIDDAITIWLEPVGDKSKLRNLRGIKFK